MNGTTASTTSAATTTADLRLTFEDLERVLFNRPEFRRVGYSVCDYLQKIEDVQDTYNYHTEAGMGASMAAYLGVSAFGMFTNFFTLVIMFNATRLMRARNYLIVLHMFTDCIQCALTTPITLLMTSHFFWYFDEWMCKAASFAKAASFFGSYVTLAALAAHLFISKYLEFSSHWFLLSYAVAGLCAVPYVLAVGTEVVDSFEPWNNVDHLEKALATCNMTRPMVCAESHWSRIPLLSQESYILSTLFGLYALPLTGLFLSLWSCRLEGASDNLKSAVLRKNGENLRMLVVLVGTMLALWLPMTVFTVMHLFGWAAFSYNRYLLCQTVGVSSAIVKPLIYGLTNRDLREMYAETLRSLLCPLDLCRRPSRRENLRRLLRIGWGERGADSSDTYDYADDDYADEEESGYVYADPTSTRSMPPAIANGGGRRPLKLVTYGGPAIVRTGVSMYDRRALYAQRLQRFHRSVS